MMRKMIEDQIERESLAPIHEFALCSTMESLIHAIQEQCLGIALSACHSAEVKGTSEFGVFRM